MCSYNEDEVSEMENKIVRVEKYDFKYILVDERTFTKSDEVNDLSKEIIHYIDPTQNKNFYFNYAAEFFDINMRTTGRYRLDGVPFGCHPVIVFVEEVEIKKHSLKK